MDRGADPGGATGRGASDRAARTVCVVPADLAGRLAEPLREHFAGSGTEVVVERRSGERRSGTERRRADVPEKVPGSGDRRQIRNPEGRRIADRRSPVDAASAPAPEKLPRRARRHAERLVFLKRRKPSAEQLEDADTARLVVAFQACDRDAFSTLYKRYFDRVFGYVRLVLRDTHEAEDVTQDTFLRALRALPRYERRSQPFRAWLFTIARNRAISTLERSSRVELAEDLREALERTPGMVSEGVSVPEWISDTDLHVFIKRLPEKQREVLVLRYLLDLEPGEIAPLLGITANHVRVLQYRALAFLRDRLTAIGRESGHRRRARMRGVVPKARVMRGRRWALLGG